MTKDEWKKVDDALSGMYGFVELLVDGYEVEFHKKQVDKTSLKIMTYVNGWFRGKWTEEDPEIKYLRRVEKSLWKKSEVEKMKKLYGKREWKKVKAKYEKKYSYYTPYWLSVTGIRRHYEKTFKDIKLVKINGETVS